MPFIALQQSTGKRIDITTIEQPRAVLQAADMVCPVCGHPMTIKAGMINRAHFAHKPGREDCPYAMYAAGETQEHREAKQLIRDLLAEWFSEYGIARPELEVYVPEVMHARNRIADVMFTFPSGWRVAHEAQLASITVEELQARSEDYESAGIDVFWWLGRDAGKPGPYEWSMNRYGFILKIDVYGRRETRVDHILYDGMPSSVRGNEIVQPRRAVPNHVSLRG